MTAEKRAQIYEHALRRIADLGRKAWRGRQRGLLPFHIALEALEDVEVAQKGTWRGQHIYRESELSKADFPYGPELE